MSDAPTQPEMRIIRRLRTLRNGAYMCIITVDTDGLASLTIIGNGKIENIRQKADHTEADNPPLSSPEH